MYTEKQVQEEALEVTERFISIEMLLPGDDEGWVDPEEWRLRDV